MARYRLKVAMAQNGRASRDTHSVVVLTQPQGAFDRVKAKQLALDFSAALAAVTFTNTNFLRSTFVQVDDNMKAVKNTQFSVPLSTTGHEVFDAGDGSAHEQVVLAIEKSAQMGKAGVTILRHPLSAVEYATYLNDGTVPARFTVSPVGTYNAGHALGTNILKAFSDNDFDMLLPPVFDLLGTTERIVETIAAQDFRNVSATKRRRSAASQIAQGAQRELNALARKAWALFKKFTGGTIPADVITAIIAIVQVASTIYNGLTAADRILVNPPTFPTLPSGT